MQHKETKDTKYDRFKDTANKMRKSNMYLIGDPERYTTNIGKNYIHIWRHNGKQIPEVLKDMHT